MTISKEVKPYIFISYAHKDEEIAKRITAFLQESGFEIWIDYNEIRAGQKFNGKIAEAIYNSSLFISLVSNTYISKPFCEAEITYAHNKQKTCMPIYIEEVIPSPGHALDFMFMDTSISGFNRNINDENDFQNLCQTILGSEYIDALKNYMSEEINEKPMPFVRPTVFDKIERFHKKSSLGNYFLSEISPELFPPIYDGEKIQKSNNNNVLLINKLKEKPKSNFLILGDGGSGKTVALKSIFKAFINEFIPVLYIPLNKIAFSDRNTILSYLEDELSLTWNMLKQYGRCEANNKPLRILLDGLNEIQGEKKKVLKEIASIMQWDNTQVIITSRGDFSDSLPQDVITTVITLKPLEENIVKTFIEKKEAYSHLSKKMLLLLSNPLMLMLYVNTNVAVMDMYQPLSKYSHYYKIQTTNEPSSEGQIIWNFLQSQLYRIDEGFSSRLVCDAYVAIEYFLPLLANYMIVRNKTNISEDEFSELLGEMLEREDYRDYYNKRLRTIERKLDIDEYNSNNLDKTILNKMALLVESADDENYEFSHQCLKDFFGAMFIAKKIELLSNEKTTDYSSISKIIYPQEILKYTSEILTEEKAKPFWEDGNLIYPGKNDSCVPSTLSASEMALAILRGNFNENAQNAVCNLMSILSIGRGKNLSNCDFSSLDLRKCNLKGGFYTEWQENNFYPSSFEGSYINIECFISSGHQAPIQAICTRGDNFFTADSEGIIKLWDFDSDIPLLTINTGNDAIISIDYDENDEKLAILKSNEVYEYDICNEELTFLNSSKMTYKYVRFNDKSQIEVTYDTQPLIWVSIDGEYVENPIATDIPSGCAVLHEGRKEILRSYFFGQIHKYGITEKGVEFLKDISVKDITSGKRITAISYNEDGSSFLLTFGNCVFEFDSETLQQIHVLNLNSPVKAACYTKNKEIIVANGVNITLLNEDFSVEKEYLGESLPNIVKLFFDDNKLYFLDMTGTIKQISDEMNIIKSRKPNFKISSIAFGSNGVCTDESKLFVITNDIKYSSNGQKICMVYDFANNTLCYPKKNYEIFDYFKDIDDMKCEYYKLSNEIVSINKTTSKTVSYTNYKGITVFGCSFKNICGSIKESEGKKLLLQNGGILDE